MSFTSLFNTITSAPNTDITAHKLITAVEEDLKAATTELSQIQEVHKQLSALVDVLNTGEQKNIEQLILMVRQHMQSAEGKAAEVQNRSAVIGALLAQLRPNE